MTSTSASNPVIRRILSAIGSNPTLLDELMKAPSDRDRKAVLVKHGLLEEHKHGPSQAEVMHEIGLMTKPVAPDSGDAVEPERMVEWVGAVGGAAGGAVAAFCWAD